MTVLSKLAVADKAPAAVKISIVSLVSAFLLYKQWKRFNERKRSGEEYRVAVSVHSADVDEIKYMIRDKIEKTPKAYVNRKFFGQLSDLINVLFPSWVSTETGFLLLIAAGLIARSICDIWLITIATQVESVIVSQNKPLFSILLLKMLTLTPLVSMVNNVLKWSIGALKLRLRKNLTLALYNDYLKSFTYYRIVNIDNRISNVDQLLTTDVDKFCDCFCDLYSNLAKPTLDIALYMYRLTTNLGVATPSIMFSYLVVSGVVLTWLRRPIGSFTVTEQKLEGEFRHINSRLITHSEEVAFYQGNRREKLILMASFQRLMRHLGKFLRFKAMMGILDNTIAKYMASVIGFYAVSIPFMSKENAFSKMERTMRFQNYYTYGRMLVKLAEAIGRLVLAGRELTRLSGFTARVTQLREILNDINVGRYKRTMVGGFKEERPMTTQGVLIFQDNVIRFDKVPLITPNGDVLIKEISFEVLSGMNVLVCGPNGCGKSSLFRVLGELWPLFGGTLTKPPRGKLFYIPQRPYMTLGTLRDQLIYPHSRQEAERRGVVDSKLFEYLQLVQLPYLSDRENGLDAIEDWIDVLSGGEKQRIAMARLFYHSPQFAILDECTSAVSVDVEGSMYQYCREVGITLFTVSHRKSLWKHHDYYLKIDGQGNYEFNKIDLDTVEFGS